MCRHKQDASAKSGVRLTTARAISAVSSSRRSAMTVMFCAVGGRGSAAQRARGVSGGVAGMLGMRVDHTAPHARVLQRRAARTDAAGASSTAPTSGASAAAATLGSAAGASMIGAQRRAAESQRARRSSRRVLLAFCASHGRSCQPHGGARRPACVGAAQQSRPRRGAAGVIVSSSPPQVVPINCRVQFTTVHDTVRAPLAAGTRQDRSPMERMNGAHAVHGALR